MTYPTIDVTDDVIFQVVRAFLLAALPPNTDVVQGQANRVPQTANTNFVVFTPVLRERLSTNEETYHDGFFDSPQTPGVMFAQQNIKMTIQLDVHSPPGGPAGDYAHIITTLFRSEWAVDQMEQSGYTVVPLYCEDPHQMPFTDGEQEIEERWTIEAVIQANPVVTVSQDFAAELKVELVNVDVVYPPT